MAKNKEITNNELAAMIEAKFEVAAKQTDAKFEVAAKQIDAKFEAAAKQTDAKIESLAKMVANGFYNMGEAIDLLKRGQERIEMRLNNVVYRTEMDVALERLQILEKQIKIVQEKS
jgi:hypothetical protein